MGAVQKVMFAALMIGAHFSTSDLMKSRTCCGLPPAVSIPRLFKNSFVFGFTSQAFGCRIYLRHDLRRNIGRRDTAYQTLASKPGRPDSETVGTFGSFGQRFADASASALIFPASTAGT